MKDWIKNWYESPNVIANFKCIQGDFLMKYKPPHYTPCPECLKMRLNQSHKEDNFTFEMGYIDLPKNIINALEPDKDHIEIPHIPVIYITSNEVLRKILLPVPDCLVCRNKQKYPVNKEILFDSQLLLDNYLGIASVFSVMDPKHPESQIENLICPSILSRVHTSKKEEVMYAGGQGITLQDAIVSMTGESVERYSALLPDKKKIIFDSADKIDELKVELSLFNKYNAQLYNTTEYKPLTSADKISWIEGFSLKHRKKCLVPASAVFLTNPLNKDEKHFDRVSSTGLASHKTIEKARMSAVLEVYERYILTRAWHEQKFPYSINLDILFNSNSEMLRKIKYYNLNLKLLLLTPASEASVVLAILKGNHFPHIVLGTSAKTNLEAAAGKAFLEAAILWQLLSSSKSHKERKAVELTEKANPLDHVRYYATPERSNWLFNKLTSKTANLSVKKINSSYQQVLDKLIKISPDIIELNITTPDCSWCGYDVLRILAPGLPIYGFGKKMSVPIEDLQRFGIKKSKYPHPFG